ncbi:disease resistance protein RGA2-like [Silene latifolia]|uniref:disease resistance protein RGA2-like n=1 Tax=Silene latifolia TaxID=37657 RepID=UPI003D76C772
MAFRAEQIENPDYDLVRVGQNIAKKCADVPLAIRVVGCLLRGQSKNKWLSFQDKVLASIDESDDISRILNFSYHRLESSVKSCFAYCAIFPKDMEIDKQMLISLWLAQGYISSYDVGEEYFETLLQRCFFQDLVKDKWGEYRWFKIHDLMHAIAERVTGGEICRLSLEAANMESHIRHLSLLYGFYTKEMFYKTQTRSCLQVNQPWGKDCIDLLQTSNLIGNWSSLRSLDLQRLVANRLTAPIGKLIHLRYLNLSGSEALEVLPDCITDLLNLQTLDLSGCTSLHKLPEHMCDLADLSTLNLDSCYNLSHMPTGIGILTGLHTLGLFVVGQASSNGKHCFDGLEDLYSLNNLKGQLEIRIGVPKKAKYTRDGGGITYLRGKKFLKRVAINFKKGKNYGSMESEQMLLEEMQPHDDVWELDLEGYHGKTMPRWPSREDNFAVFHLPYLVTLVISQCEELLYLPLQAGKLPRLKKLELSVLPKMEYMVNVSPEVSGVGEGTSFFPCLKELYISKLPKLKGWWPSTGSEVQNQYLTREKTPCFAQLKKVEINECPMLAYMPVCSCPDDLRVYDFGRLLKCVTMSHIPHQHQTLSRLNPKLKILTIDHLEWLKLMPTRSIQRVAVIEVNDEKVESLGELKKLLHNLSSLQFVKFKRCLKLRNDGGWLTQLSALHSLSIDECPNHLVDGIPWKNLPRSLKCLSLISLEEMENLPEGMQYCTSLSSLIIQYCPKLQSIPNWMPQLTSLQTLKLHCSKTLKRQCQNPYGKDRLLIQHIRTISIKEIQGKGNEETWIKEEWWH